MEKEILKVGNVADYADKRGWISGSFFPPDVLNHDPQVEIKIETLTEPLTVKKHYHKFRKSWVLVLEGEIDFTIDSTPVKLLKGDFLIFGPGITEEVTSSKPGTMLVSIHSPSGENDKVEV